jgi:predicted cupin superfamily sugar epimerase
MITIEQIKSLLNLEPLPEEGGYYFETYRSTDSLSNGVPDRYSGDRSLSTAIYYLLTPDTFSALHSLPTDEIFHFYLGDPVEMLQLWPDGSGKVVVLGTDLINGMLPQLIVPKGVWQGSRLVPGGQFALLGTTVAPGFEFADYATGSRDRLVSQYPEFRNLIVGLTR